MTHSQKSVSLGLILAVVLIGAALPAGAAVASTGEITRAEANSDWTKGHIVGWVEWTGCERWVSYRGFPGEVHPPPPSCGWIPYATVAPGFEPAECASKDRRLSSLGEDVTLAWVGEEEIRLYPEYTETVEFNVSEVPLSGGTEQLVCLSLIETAPEYVACIQIFPSSCPPYWITSIRHNLSSAQMVTSPEIKSPSEEGKESEDSSAAEEVIGGPDQVPSTSSSSISQPPPNAKVRRCPKGKHRVKRAGHTFCKHRQRRHHRHQRR